MIRKILESKLRRELHLTWGHRKRVLAVRGYRICREWTAAEDDEGRLVCIFNEISAIEQVKSVNQDLDGSTPSEVEPFADPDIDVILRCSGFTVSPDAGRFVSRV